MPRWSKWGPVTLWRVLWPGSSSTPSPGAKGGGTLHDGKREVVTDPSDTGGHAIAPWTTRAPSPPFLGTAPGRYRATVVVLTDDETIWDGVETTAAFVLD